MIKSIDIKYANNTNITGFDTTVADMSIYISNGQYTCLDDGVDISIDQSQIDLEILNEDRTIGVYAINDPNEPLVCTEEVGKNEGGNLDNLLMCLCFIKITSGCTSLSEADATIYNYTEQIQESDTDDGPAPEPKTKNQ